MLHSILAALGLAAGLRTAAHERFIAESALCKVPKGLDAAASSLLARGEVLVEPGRDASLHPMLIPLTRNADGEVTGLLRWPGAGTGWRGTTLPLVRTAQGGQQLRLLADSCADFVTREAVLADAREGSDAAEAASLAASIGFTVTPGEAAATPGGLAGYLLLKTQTPAAQDYEERAAAHRERGDTQSALIACEASELRFGRWGRPYSFHAALLEESGRAEEARDVARQALALPLWTAGHDLEALATLACTTIDELVAKARLASEGKLTEEQLRVQNYHEERSPAQIARDRASAMLDLVALCPEEYTYASARPELAELWRASELEEFADFVEATGATP